jgi:hypothetical protein
MDGSVLIREINGEILDGWIAIVAKFYRKIVGS